MEGELTTMGRRRNSFFFLDSGLGNGLFLQKHYFLWVQIKNRESSEIIIQLLLHTLLPYIVYYEETNTNSSNPRNQYMMHQSAPQSLWVFAIVGFVKFLRECLCWRRQLHRAVIIYVIYRIFVSIRHRFRSSCGASTYPYAMKILGATAITP